MPSLPDFESHLRRRWPFGWRVYQEVQRVDVGFVANSVAFQAFGALFPLLVVVFLLVALVSGEALAEQVLEVTESFLPEQTRTLLANAIAAQLTAGSTSVVGIAVLLWGALNLFKGLDTAFSIIYRTESENSIVDQTEEALITFLVLLAAVVVAVIAGGVAFLTRLPLVDLLAPLVLVVGLTAVFFPMYYLFPDAALSPRDALPGAVVAAVGWTVLEGLFGVYVALTAGDAAGGAVGALLLLLTWLYFGSFLLLLGAVVNAVLAGVDEGAIDAGEGASEEGVQTA